MNPWEETWWLDAEQPQTSGAEVLWNGSVSAGVSVQFGKQCGPPGGGWWEASEDDIDRARLASAAPDMARLLIQINALAKCYFCHADTEATGFHKTDCRLVAMARKAGIPLRCMPPTEAR